jgi:hypothetical protein
LWDRDGISFRGVLIPSFVGVCSRYPLAVTVIWGPANK